MLAAALALALAASVPCGVPELAAERPFAPGEILTFDVDVMGVVKAGTLSLAVEKPILEGAQIPLRARVKNTSVFAKIRRLRGAAVSFVDASSLRPQRFRDEVDQDGVRRTTDTRLDRPGPVRMSWTSGPEKGVTDYERKGESLDILAAVYLLRAARLEPGAAMCFDLLGNRRYWRFRGTVASKVEPVETPAGTFETLRIDARLARADAPAVGRPLHLWISTDENHVLVAAVSEVDLGPVRALLVRRSTPSGSPQD